jgi:ABC-type phosphate transport system substrate-binding protein
MNNQRGGIFYFFIAVGVSLLIFFGLWKGCLERRIPKTKSINFHIPSHDDEDNGDAEVLFKMVGSSTLGKELAPALAKAFMEKQGMKVINDEEDDEKSIIIGEKDDKKYSIRIKAETSNEAFESLEDEDAQIGLSSRKIKSEEAASLSSFGDMNSHDCEHIVALDGIAIIVSPNL